MKQLYIDFDGVILDTMTRSYEELKKENIDIKNQEKVMEFFRNLYWKKLIEEMAKVCMVEEVAVEKRFRELGIES